MTYRTELLWEELAQKMQTPARTWLRETPALKEMSAYVTDLQGGLTDLAWGRILFDTGDTQSVTLIIDDVAKTISCLPGANLFAKHKVGAQVQITGFSVNVTNNQTTEVTSKISNDSIGISKATGLVSEQDASARAQGNPFQYQLDKITAIKALMTQADLSVTDIETNLAPLLRDFA